MAGPRAAARGAGVGLRRPRLPGDDGHGRRHRVRRRRGHAAHPHRRGTAGACRDAHRDRRGAAWASQRPRPAPASPSAPPTSPGASRRATRARAPLPQPRLPGRVGGVADDGERGRGARGRRRHRARGSALRRAVGADHRRREHARRHSSSGRRGSSPGRRRARRVAEATRRRLYDIGTFRSAEVTFAARSTAPPTAGARCPSTPSSPLQESRRFLFLYGVEATNQYQSAVRPAGDLRRRGRRPARSELPRPRLDARRRRPLRAVVLEHARARRRCPGSGRRASAPTSMRTRAARSAPGPRT